LGVLLQSGPRRLDVRTKTVVMHLLVSKKDDFLVC
jgi:hypothetical protein